MTTLGERCVEVALAEYNAGVKEEPLGSNSGPRVREYLAPCVRGDKNVKLGLTASNWCMAFASWCLFQALKEEDGAPPHGYRAGVVEAVADARDHRSLWTGHWVPVESVRKGLFLPETGDLAIYDRSQQGRPETSWWRHVNRVMKYDVEEKTFTTIGGNEGQKVSIGQQSIYKSNLLGFIEYPKGYTKQKTELTPEEASQIANLVYMTIDGMIRDSLYGEDGEVWKHPDEE